MKSSADILLNESLALLAPLVRSLVQQGVTYPQFATAVKAVFFEMARRELQAQGQRETDSAISVLSGVHRKDVRVLGASQAQGLAPGLTLASQIFTRWATDPVYRDKRNKPLALARSGPEPSFESLAFSVSKDVHPRTALEELVRLGVAQLDDEMVRLNAEAFVPRQGFAEMAALLSHNVADHLAAGTHNMAAGEGPKFLEQSVFANGLAADSAAQLGALSRELWAQAFERMVAQATTLVKRDEARPGSVHRLRFGVYFFAEPQSEPVLSTGKKKK